MNKQLAAYDLKEGLQMLCFNMPHGYKEWVHDLSHDNAREIVELLDSIKADLTKKLEEQPADFIADGLYNQ